MDDGPLLTGIAVHSAIRNSLEGCGWVDLEKFRKLKKRKNKYIKTSAKSLRWRYALVMLIKFLWQHY